MAGLPELILEKVNELGTVDTLALSSILKEDHQKIIGAVKSIQCLGEIIEAEPISTKLWELTDEGKEVTLKGSHEALIFNAVPEEGITQAELMSSVPNAKVGFSKAMSKGWIVWTKVVEKCQERFRK